MGWWWCIELALNNAALKLAANGDREAPPPSLENGAPMALDEGCRDRSAAKGTPLTTPPSTFDSNGEEEDVPSTPAVVVVVGTRSRDA